MNRGSPAVVETVASDGLVARAVSRQGCEDLFVTATLDRHPSVRAMFQCVADLIAARDASIVSVEVFGLAAGGPDAAAPALREVFGEIAWPLTWLDEGSQNEPPLAGIVVHGVCGLDVTPVQLRGRAIGSVYEDEFARYCVLGGLQPLDLSLDRPAQARQVFEGMFTALDRAGMAFADVVRTWLWVDNILDWYGEFNKVRTAFFDEHGVFDVMVPASTGIGGHNASGSALDAALFAVRAKGPGVEASTVPSPLQDEPGAYGSSFSRAAELVTPQYRQIFVSGTASIARTGETMYVGDVDAQIARTMEVVKAILESRRMTWADVSRSLAYCRKATDAPAFRAYCEAHGLQTMPALVANNTVCRDNLLFEIEVDAIVPNE